MNLKHIKKIILFLFLITFTNNIFSQETVQWSINKIAGKKCGKIICGPFNSLDEAIANWIYLTLKDNKKICIAENNEIKSQAPSVDLLNEYNSLLKEYTENRTEYIKKYNIIVNPTIEKNYENELKKKKSEEKKKEKKYYSKKTKEDELLAEEQKKAEEERLIQEKLKEEQEKKDKEEQEKLEKARLELELLLKKEQAEQDALLKMIESTKKASAMELSKKEYLQDYIVPEENLIPEQERYTDYEVILNPNEVNANGQTQLMLAAKAGNEWQLKNLIKQGADVNLQDKDGWTALMYAVRYQESLSTVEVLLKANADIKLKNNFDSSALLIGVVYNNNPNVIRRLLDYYVISEKDVMKSFVMLLTSHSSEYSQLAKINVFIDKAIPLNTFYEGKTPLMYAAQFGSSTKIIKILIENNSITSLRSTEGKTAFDYAIENKNLQQDADFWLLNKK